MASLNNQLVSNTYKDLLTVSGTTSNEGLENTAKRVFDGEGTGSPLYLGTSTLDVVGTSTFTGSVTISGKTTTNTLKLNNLSSLPSSPETGEVALVNGEIYINI